MECTGSELNVQGFSEGGSRGSRKALVSEIGEDSGKGSVGETFIKGEPVGVGRGTLEDGLDISVGSNAGSKVASGVDIG